MKNDGTTDDGKEEVGLTLTMKDRIAIAIMTQNQKEREVAEAAVHLVSKFHNPPLTVEQVMGWTLENLLRVFKEQIEQRIITASKSGDGAMAELRAKMH